MAEWLYEQGIGENRAVLVADGAILEAWVERADDGLTVGTVGHARVTSIAGAYRRAVVRFQGGEEALIEPLPSGIAEGAAVVARIVREAVPEPGRAKRARAVIAEPGAAPGAGPALRARIAASPQRVTECRIADAEDRFEAVGWSELLEEAASGEIAFAEGALRIALTPAMTLIDVDGDGERGALALAGARAAAAAIRRLGLAGSIGIDLPTVQDRAQRLAIGAALDAALPAPFERTAVNGFGFVQIVRRRERPSLAERMRFAPVHSAALALLRRAERAGGTGTLRLVAHPAVIGYLTRHQDWTSELARRSGRMVALAADENEGIHGGHIG